MTKSSITRKAHHSLRRGFTLIEVLVALAIFMVLMIVIMVPMNLALQTTQIGRARSEVQTASQSTLSQMEKEMRRAVYVFPNTQMPGITDGAPYSNNGGKPYVEVNDLGDLSQGVCGGGTPVNNTSRIDFLLPKSDDNGSVSTPLENADYLVSYYARRLYSTRGYDQFENPIVMFRAQVPYRDANGYPLDANFKTIRDGSGDPFMDPNSTQAHNALVDGSRYYNASNCGSNPTNINRGARWLTQGLGLTQNIFHEPNLEPYTDPFGTSGSHTLLMPRGMGLVAPYAPTATDKDVPIADVNRSYQPTTSFTCDDTNNDGKIDRVTINLELSQFGAGGAAAKAQRVRTSLTVDFPNIR